jgi:hypothetical protein
MTSRTAWRGLRWGIKEVKEGEREGVRAMRVRIGLRKGREGRRAWSRACVCVVRKREKKKSP